MDFYERQPFGYVKRRVDGGWDLRRGSQDHPGPDWRPLYDAPPPPTPPLGMPITTEQASRTCRSAPAGATPGSAMGS